MTTPIAIVFVSTAIIVLIGILGPDKPIAEERMDVVLAAAAMATVLAFIAMGCGRSSRQRLCGNVSEPRRTPDEVGDDPVLKRNT